MLSHDKVDITCWLCNALILTLILIIFNIIGGKDCCSEYITECLGEFNYVSDIWLSYYSLIMRCQQLI